ncbi:carbohydrate binding domain-containing protein [Streptomyces sp. AC563]|uniref:carbohydrate binding domain-containing protein n=1 Tax=Streptomyces buecherae TaxID=2763006 RepID=UPI00164DB7EA|nr:carbohydrate binding domain-containing protein [Streptomyces buecherae]MBC3989328.1 carbohydrate binding domain-containing protein [Streptomyces buecherae]
MRLIVEVAFGYAVTAASQVWTDITRYVDVGPRGGVRITRGASDELGEVQPGTCTLTLNNADGRFTSGRAASPYYPNVRKNVPLRVRTISAQKNLLTNPGFDEVTLDGWGVSAGPSMVLSATHVHQGILAARLTWGAPIGQAAAADIHGLDAGSRYTASAYVWVAAGAPPVIAGIEALAVGSTTTITDAWQRVSVSFTATGPTHRLLLQAVGTPTPGTQCWIDSAQVEEGPVATAFDPAPAQVHDRFWGMVNDWPVAWQGTLATTTITCTDIFKWLSRQPALLPMLGEEILLDLPTVYFPMTESSEAGAAGDMSGTTGVGTLMPAQLGAGGSITFGDSGAPTGSTGAGFEPASASAGKYLAADLGPTFVDGNSLWRMRIEVWFSTSTTGRVLLATTTADGSNRLVISLDATGKLRMESAVNNGPLITATVAATPNLADGQVHQLLYNEIDGLFRIDGVSYSVSNVGLMANMRRLYVGGWTGGNLWAGTISHLAIWVRDLATADLLSHYTTGATGHAGEPADERMVRLAGYLPLAVTTVGSAFDGMAAQAALGRTPLDHMQEVAATEAGRLLADRAGPDLVFQSRDVRYNPLPIATLAYADLETDGVEVADDDQKMLNTIIASRPGGATQRVLDQAARDTYGPYEQQLDLLKASDLKVSDAANWLVSRYADPPPEIRQVPVQAYTLPLETYRALLEADISAVLEITGLPDQAPAPTASLTIEGYTETITYRQHRLDLHTSRALTDAVWVLASASYSQLGINTRLAY